MAFFIGNSQHRSSTLLSCVFRLTSGLRSYAEFIKAWNQRSSELLVHDPRSQEERDQAAELQAAMAAAQKDELQVEQGEESCDT